VLILRMRSMLRSAWDVCDKQMRERFQSSRLIGVRLWAVINNVADSVMRDMRTKQVTKSWLADLHIVAIGGSRPMKR